MDSLTGQVASKFFLIIIHMFNLFILLQITLARALDRERQKVYEVRVEAHDLGVPTPLQSDLDLTVYVRNINDHEPKFIVDTFRFLHLVSFSSVFFL